LWWAFESEVWDALRDVQFTEADLAHVLVEQTAPHYQALADAIVAQEIVLGERFARRAWSAESVAVLHWFINGGQVIAAACDTFPAEVPRGARLDLQFFLLIRASEARGYPPLAAVHQLLPVIHGYGHAKRELKARLKPGGASGCRSP
jgi:hypothetical protein